MKKGQWVFQWDWKKLIFMRLSPWRVFQNLLLFSQKAYFKMWWDWINRQTSKIKVSNSMASISMFDQIKTEPLQFYPSQTFTNSQQQPGTVILQSSSAAIIGKPNDVS